MPTPQPGVYRKGHETRVADTASQAVALAYDGFRRETAESVAAELSRPELQAKAKELGIPANKSSAEIAAAIANAPAGDVTPAASNLDAPDLSYVSALGDGTDEVEDDGPPQGPEDQPGYHGKSDS